jgi:hypothetical protein
MFSVTLSASFFQICFPTLQCFPGLANDQSGHYWLVNLNLKAERFEIYDSLAKNVEALMMDSCHFLIGAIKAIWASEYQCSTGLLNLLIALNGIMVKQHMLSSVSATF